MSMQMQVTRCCLYIWPKELNAFSKNCIQLLKQHSIIPFDPCFLVMNPRYSEENREIVVKDAAFRDIPTPELFTGKRETV